MTQLLRTRASGALLVILLCILWEASVRTSLVQSESWPALTEIGRVFADGHRTAELLGETGGSLRRMLQGFLLGSLIGLVAGVFMGFSRTVFSTLQLSLELLRVIPIPALVPPAVLFLGLDDTMKVSIIALAAIWPVLLNTLHGVRSVDETLIETTRTFKAPISSMIWSVFIPAAAPLIIAGLRLSIAAALITTIVAEMIVGSGGIGAYIVLMEQAARMPEVYAAIFVLSVLGYAMNRGLLWIENRYVPWASMMPAS